MCVQIDPFFKCVFHDICIWERLKETSKDEKVQMKGKTHARSGFYWLLLCFQRKYKL